MREFERTGIYPEYLIFNLPGTRKNWRVKIKEKPQTGILRSKGMPVFEYSYNGHWCKFREVKDDDEICEWAEPEIINVEMRD